MRSAIALLSTCAALAIGCGADDTADAPSGPATSPPDTTTTAPPPGATGAESECPDVPVTGHRATDVQATGVGCDQASEVAAAALGEGRRPYRADEFTCEPSPADGGDTNYACSNGTAQITFRYGAT